MLNYETQWAIWKISSVGKKTHYHAWWNAAAPMPMCKDTVVYKHSVFRWACLVCCSTLRNELMVHDTLLLKTFPISVPFQRFCKNSMALSYDINSRCCSLWRSYRKSYNLSSWMFLRKSLYQLHFWAHHWTLNNHHSVRASPFLIGYVEKHNAASKHQRYSNHNWNVESLWSAVPFDDGHSTQLPAKSHIPTVHKPTYTVMSIRQLLFVTKYAKLMQRSLFQFLQLLTKCFLACSWQQSFSPLPKTMHAALWSWTWDI
jgi:hypothetical protein